MYYNRHYCISASYENLRSTLENQYGIEVTVLTNHDTGLPTFFIFDVSDMHPQIDQLDRLLPEEAPAEHSEKQALKCMESQLGLPAPFAMIIYTPQYTQDELHNAQWLQIRNVTSKVNPVNLADVDTLQCFAKFSKSGVPLGYHEVQAKPYIIKKPIKMGRASFVSAVYHEERLFCSKKTRNLLEHNGFKEIQYLPVFRKTTGQPMEDFFQIDTPHVVPDGAIIAISGMTKHTCKQCGMHMLRWGDGRSQFGLRKDVLDESVDIWKTQPMFFGRGGTETQHSAQRVTIISQRFYRFLIEHRLDRGFVFIPLELIKTGDGSLSWNKKQ